MLPIAALLIDIYIERWGDPNNPNAVLDDEQPQRKSGWLRRTFARLFSPGKRATAWSFTLPPNSDQDDKCARKD